MRRRGLRFVANFKNRPLGLRQIVEIYLAYYSAASMIQPSKSVSHFSSSPMMTCSASRYFAEFHLGDGARKPAATAAGFERQKRSVPAATPKTTRPVRERTEAHTSNTSEPPEGSGSPHQTHARNHKFLAALRVAPHHDDVPTEAYRRPVRTDDEQGRPRLGIATYLHSVHQHAKPARAGRRLDGDQGRQNRPASTLSITTPPPAIRSRRQSI